MSTKDIIQAAAGTGGGGTAWDLAFAYYDPPTAWNISTAVSASISYSVSAQETIPLDVFFKPDGTKMYVLGSEGDDVNEYSLSRPWLASSATYVQNFSVATQDTSPTGLYFKPDGTKMYVSGDVDNFIYEYTLSTAWDISTASYVQNFFVDNEDKTPNGVEFKPDGTKMYMIGALNDRVNEYNLSTPWDISTATYLQNFSVVTRETEPRKVRFKSDGTKMYVMGTSGDDINEYSLSTPWDVSTASYVTIFSVSGQSSAPQGLYFRPDGGAFYMVARLNSTGSLDQRVHQYVIGGFNVSAQEASPFGLFFKDDGTKMYVCGTTGDAVDEWALSTPWNISTATYTTQFSVSSQDITPRGIYFSPDGTRLYVVGGNDDDINQYSLSTAWNISTASYVRVFSVFSQETEPTGVFFKPDGTKMYVIGTTGDDINEYTLSTPWDISTASYVQVFSVAAEDTAPNGFFFRDDGAKMYVTGASGRDVNEYDLSTPWDISTASYVQNFYLGNQDVSIRQIYFKPDGTQFFVVGQLEDRIYTYTIGEQP